MPDRETRYKIITEFVTQGDPGASVKVHDDTAKAQQKVAESSTTSGAAVAAAGKKHAEAAKEAEGLAGSLKKASDASYLFGMGAMYTGIPMTNFVAQAGNMINGTGMMAEGFGALLDAIDPVTLAITVGVVAVTGIGMAMIASARATQDFVAQLRNLSAVSGMSIGQAGAAANMMSGQFGAAGVQGLAAVGQYQSTISPQAMFEQTSIARMGAGGRTFFPALSDPLARFGATAFAPGSTIYNPQPLPPDQVLFGSAQAVLRQQTPALQAQAMTQMGGRVGGVDLLSRMVEELKAQRTQNPGQNDQQLFKNIQAQNKFWVPSDADVENIRAFDVASNHLNEVMAQFGRQIGSVVIPAVTPFISALDKIISFLQPVLIPALKLLTYGILAALVVVLAALVVAFAPLILILVTVGGIIQAIATGWQLLTQAIKPSVDWINANTTATKAFVTANAPSAWQSFSDTVNKAWSDIWNSHPFIDIRNTFDTVAAGGWQGLLVSVSAAWNWATTQAFDAWAWFAATPVGQTLIATVNAAWSWLTTQASNAWAWFASTPAGQTLIATVNAAWGWVNKTASDAYAWYTTTPVGQLLTVSVSSAWNWLTSAAADVYKWFTNPSIPTPSVAVSAAWNWATTNASNAYTWFTQTVAPALAATITGAWNWATTAAANAYTWFNQTATPTINATISAAITWVSQAVQDVITWLAGASGTINQAVQMTFASITGTIWTWLQNLYNWAGNTINMGFGVLNQGAGTVWNWLTLFYNWLTSALTWTIRVADSAANSFWSILINFYYWTAGAVNFAFGVLAGGIGSIFQTLLNLYAWASSAVNFTFNFLIGLGQTIWNDLLRIFGLSTAGTAVSLQDVSNTTTVNFTSTADSWITTVWNNIQGKTLATATVPLVASGTGGQDWITTVWNSMQNRTLGTATLPLTTSGISAGTSGGWISIIWNNMAGQTLSTVLQVSMSWVGNAYTDFIDLLKLAGISTSGAVTRQSNALSLGVGTYSNQPPLGQGSGALVGLAYTSDINKMLVTGVTGTSAAGTSGGGAALPDILGGGVSAMSLASAMPANVGGGRGGGALMVVNNTFNIAALDFSDPRQVQQITKRIGDQIVNNMRVLAPSMRIV